jgi:hypothetical protein
MMNKTTTRYLGDKKLNIYEQNLFKKCQEKAIKTYDSELKK